MLRTIRPTLVLLLLFASLASCGRGVDQEDGASFCRPNEVFGMMVEIDFSRNMGTWEDVIMPLSHCSESYPACIDFPVFFSAPPEHDWSDQLPYSWEVGSVQFSIEQPSKPSKDQFLITAQGTSNTMYYQYRRDNGVVSFRLGESEEDRWTLCSGRLTFDRLSAWYESVKLDDANE